MERVINSFVIHRSYRDSIKHFPVEVRCELWEAMTDYAFDNIEPNLTGPSMGLWLSLKPTIDSSIKKYIQSVENGKKGGAPEGNKNAKKQPKNNPQTTEEQPTINLDKDKDKDIDKDIPLNPKGLKDSNGGFGKLWGVFPTTKQRNELDCLVIWDKLPQKEKQQVIRHATMYIKGETEKGNEKFIKSVQSYLESEMWKDMKPKTKEEAGVSKSGLVDFNFFKYVVTMVGELPEYSTIDLAMKNIHFDQELKDELWKQYKEVKVSI